MIELVLDDGWQLHGPGVARARHAAEAGAVLPAALLEQLRGGRGPVRVSVSLAHARLWVLPFAPLLDRESRWAGFAAASFERAFGDAAEGWLLRWQREVPPRPRLAAALPAALVAALRGALGARLVGLGVDVLAHLPALRARRFSGALVLLQPRRCVLVLLRRGVPERVRLRRGACGAPELGALLATEWAALPAAAGAAPAPLPALALAPAPQLTAEQHDALARLAPTLWRLA